MNCETTHLSPSRPDLPIRPITEREFALFQRLIQKRSGIHLGPAKKALLVGRLTRRLRELGIASFQKYYDLVTDIGNPNEQIHMLDSICTNETRFFREPRQFEFLKQQVFPEWEKQVAANARNRTIRVWSTACSTGEEPYSLAMAILERFPPTTPWKVQILASDLSTRALERAEEGVWRIEKSKDIPPPYLKAFMLKGNRTQQGWMKAGAEISSVIDFARVNLNENFYRVAGPFDLIFCRNVLIYFDADCKTRVIERLIDQLAPGGYLFVGHAESLNGMTSRARPVAPTIYAKADGAAAEYGLALSAKR